jgi:hypothetical protein
MGMRQAWLLFLLLGGAFGSPAREPEKSLCALRSSNSILLDGHLDEPRWQQAPVAEGFTQQWPKFGRAATLPTEVRVLYDDQFLYVGARLLHPKHLSPGGKDVRKRLHRRDQESPSDWFAVFIDSLHSRSTGAGFWVNAAGVQRDAAISADTGLDYSWDAVWESAVAVDATGWTAELKIPLSLLRIRRDGPQVWGINFARFDQGEVRETSYWHLVPRGENAFVSRFPELSGIDGIKPQARREFIPFLSVRRKFETTEVFEDRVWKGSAGLDGHFTLNSHSQVDLSVRPDFGQVEVDQAVLNLGSYETYFPEKRPFFLEGAEIFKVAGANLFYSRRIGAGLSNPSLGAGQILQGRPDTTEISAAAKYTGHLPGGLTVGLLGAGVEPAKADLVEPSGVASSRELYPATAFGVTRVRQDFGSSGSYLGGFASWLRQAGSSGRSAWVQALDSRLKSPDRSSTLEMTLTRSEAGTRDLPLVAGWAGRLHANQQWRSGWSADVQAWNFSRDFNPNDLGYLSRPDERHLQGTLGKQGDEPGTLVQNWNASLSFSRSEDQDGRAIGRWVGASAYSTLIHFIGLWGNAGLNLPAHDDRELRTFADPNKKYLFVARIPTFGIGVDTAGNKPWYLRLTLDRAWFRGGPSMDTRLYQSIKPTESLEFQLDTLLARDSGEPRWAETQGATPIIGLRKLTQLNQILRVAYAFSPTLTVQAFTQWLDASWAFRDLQAYADDDTLVPGAAASQTAFSSRLWNVNLITRWEFRPGSTFYLVYTHGANTNAVLNDPATLRPWSDLIDLRHLPSDDVVQVKLSWLFR